MPLLARSFILFWLGWWSPAALYALGLDEIYQLAQRHDPRYLAEQARYAAQKEAWPQARAALLPQLSASVYQSQSNGQNNLTVSPYEYNSNGYSLSLTQTLYDHDAFLQLAQASSREAQARAGLLLAEQDLILRVAERYFAVLAATDALAFAQAEQKAVARQLTQAKQRFKVGLTAVTDVHEAQAAYDLTVAQEISAKNQLSISQEQLRELTNQTTPKLDALSDTISYPAPSPTQIESWVTQALQQNLSLQIAKLAQDIAKDEVSRQRAGHYPTLGLVLSQSHSESGTGNPIGQKDTDESVLSLQLDVPLFSGGYTQSRTREARYQFRASQQEYEQERRATERQVRNSYLAVIALISQVKALDQALASSRIALQATQTGYEAGTRTAVDVLAAQRERFRARSQYARARYDYLLETLRLKKAAGILAYTDLEKINQWLEE